MRKNKEGQSRQATSARKGQGAWLCVALSLCLWLMLGTACSPLDLLFPSPEDIEAARRQKAAEQTEASAEAVGNTADPSTASQVRESETNQLATEPTDTPEVNEPEEPLPQPTFGSLPDLAASRYSQSVDEEGRKGEARIPNLFSLLAKQPPVPEFPHLTDTERMQKLGERIQDYLASRGLQQAKIALAFQDLRRQEAYFYQEDVRFHAASTIKLAIALTCAQFVEEGVFQYDMPIARIGDQEMWNYGEGEALGLVDEHNLAPLEAYLGAALRHSNNEATSVLFRFFKANGLWLHRAMDEMVGTHYAKDVSMSARVGLNLLLRLMENPEQIQSYDVVRQMMRESSWNQFATARFPSDLSYGNKYGSALGVNHDFVFVEGAHPFVFVVMTESLPPSVLQDLGALFLQFQEETAEETAEKMSAETSGE